MAPSCLLLKKAATQIGTYRMDSSACFTGLPQIPKQFANPTKSKVSNSQNPSSTLQEMFCSMVSSAADCLAPSASLLLAVSQNSQHLADFMAHRSTPSGHPSACPHPQLPHHCIPLVSNARCWRWGRKPAQSTQQLPPRARCPSTQRRRTGYVRNPQSQKQLGAGAGGSASGTEGRGGDISLQVVLLFLCPSLLPAHTLQHKPENLHISA